MPKLRDQKVTCLHAVLANTAVGWRDARQPLELHRYVLRHGAGHLAAAADHERLWFLLRDEDYRDTQIALDRQFDMSFRALQYGLDCYARRDGQNTEDDARLCWLALRAGKLGSQARADVNVAFQWSRDLPVADPQRVPRTLQRLASLDGTGFFHACILLLWFEAERQAGGRDGNSEANTRLILERLASRKEADRPDWSQSVAPDFMAWFCLYLAGLMPELDLAVLWTGTSRAEDFIGCLATQVRHARTAGEPLPRQFLARTATAIEQRTRAQEHGALATLLLAMGEKTAALRQARSITSPTIRGLALTWLAKAGAAETLPQYTEELLNAAREPAAAGPVDWAKVDCLAQIGCVADELGRPHVSAPAFEGAISTAALIADAGFRSAALCRIAELLAQAGHLQRARDLFGESRSVLAIAAVTPERRQVLLVGQVRHLADAGFHEDAAVFASKIPPGGNHEIALRFMVEAWAQAGHVEKARLVEQSMESGHYNVEARAAMAIAIAKAGNIDEAENILNKTRHNTHVSKAWTAVAACLAGERQSERAQAAFQQTLQATAATPAISKLDMLLAATVPGLARAGGFGQAQPVLARVMDEACLLQAIEELSTVLTDAGAFTRLLECANRLRNGARQQQAWSAIARALVQRGAAEAVLDMFARVAPAPEQHEIQQMLVGATCRAIVVAGGGAALLDRLEAAASAIAEPGSCALAFAHIAVTSARIGDPTRAERAVASALNEAHKLADAHRGMVTFPTLVGLLVDAGQETRAREFTETITEPSTKENCWRALAEHLAARGDVETASVLATTLVAPDQRARASIAIGAAHARSGKPHLRRQYVEQALTAAGEISTPPVRDRTHKQVAVSLARTGSVDNAFSISERIASQSIRHEALSDILNLAAARKDFGALERLAGGRALGQDCYEQLLPTWRHRLAMADRAGDLRRSLTLCPFSDALAHDGVGRLLGYHLEHGASPGGHLLVAVLPEFGLDFVMH